MVLVVVVKTVVEPPAVGEIEDSRVSIKKFPKTVLIQCLNDAHYCDRIESLVTPACTASPCWFIYLYTCS